MTTPTGPGIEGLANCPFCGSKPYYTETVNGTSMAKVGCAKCGVEIKCAWGMGRPGEFGWSKDIRAAWNTRPNDLLLLAVEALRAVKHGAEYCDELGDIIDAALIKINEARGG